MNKSGREDLSLDDRAGLLDQMYYTLERGPVDPSVNRLSGINGRTNHDFGALKGWMYHMSEGAKKYHKEGVDPANSWLRRLSYCERCAMAWQRGGFEEHRKLIKIGMGIL